MDTGQSGLWANVEVVTFEKYSVSQTGAMLFSFLKNFGWFVRSFYWARKFPFELPIEFLVTLIRKNVSLWITCQRTFPSPDSEMKAPRALTKKSFVSLRRHTLSYPNTHLRVDCCIPRLCFGTRAHCFSPIQFTTQAAKGRNYFSIFLPKWRVS